MAVAAYALSPIDLIPDFILPECHHLPIASNLTRDTSLFHLPRPVPGVFDASIKGNGHNAVPPADLRTSTPRFHSYCAEWP
jgi:hypothetical protein